MDTFLDAFPCATLFPSLQMTKEVPWARRETIAGPQFVSSTPSWSQVTA